MKKLSFILSLILIIVVIHPANISAEGKSPDNPKTRIYTGEDLRTIAFPVGGLGTGNITIGGRGEIREMEIFNRPAKGISPNLTFFSIWAGCEGQTPFAKILERELLPPYVAWGGIPRMQLPGVSRFDEVSFMGEYPFAWLEFKDKDIPVKVILETYNPFIPLDPERSGIPGAVFNWKLKNEKKSTVMVSIAFSMQNLIKTENENGNITYGKNLNEYTETDSFRGIRMSSNRAKPDSLEYGNITICTTGKRMVGQRSCFLGRFFR